jgi:hypothetical protein
MIDRIVGESELLGLVNELARERTIVGPTARNGRHFYERVEKADRLELGFDYCVYSPRGWLFPPQEVLLTFQTSDGHTEARPNTEAPLQALVGVHPCDINAIRLLDRAFAHNNRDDHYLRRRARTMIVGIDCPRTCTEGVFCADMGGNEATQGFDVMCYPLGEGGGGERRYAVVFGTAAGREWVLYNQAGASPTVDDERAFVRYKADKAAAFPRVLPFDVDHLPALLDRSYDSLLWEATARRCYSCGSCNLSCPTCYCFDVYDEVDLNLTSGSRSRVWDGCQLKSFAEVAGGHNFRASAAARLRHRIYRKGKWVKEREGLPGCVGCARCDRACTAKINSVELYNQLAEEEG